MTPTLAELRRSYWWGSRYIESLYAGGVVREYHTRTPFTQVAWLKRGGVWWGMVHPIGCGLLKEFTECVPLPEVTTPNWHTFSKIHQVWSYVHSATRDYNVIARLGFEDTEPDWIVVNASGAKFWQAWGDRPCGAIPIPPCSDQDCDEPLIMVEYTRNLLKNGFFAFRQYLNTDPERDLPAFWTVYPTPSPTGRIEGGDFWIGLSTDAYQGPYSLKIRYKAQPYGMFAAIYSADTEILPDTEYVLSMYFKGQINFYSHCLQIDFYDKNSEFITSVRKWLDYGEYAEWQNCELRFRTPENAHFAVVYLEVMANPEPWPYSESTAYFDAFWLSECPINLNPFYKVMAQIESYGGDREADIYFNGSLVWREVSSTNLPRGILEETVPLDGIPAFRSAIRHSVQNGVFYYKHTSMHPEWQIRSEALQSYREANGYTYDYYHPLWRETDTYPDDFMFLTESFHDCDAWFTEKGTPLVPPYIRYLTFYPYWSKICLCRSIGIEGLALRNPYFSALLAIHLMNKYGDPFKKVGLPYPSTVSAYDLLFEGVPIVGVKVIQALKDWIDPDKGWDRGGGVYSIYASACAMAAFAEIGYGFQQEMENAGYGGRAVLARDIADRLAATVLKNQWGYPFQSGKTGYFRHEDFGEVNIPEAAGGFLVLTVYKDGEPYATSRKDLLTELTDVFNMPSETPGVLPVNQETTFVCMRALQIYEWYKYKGGKGAFPKLLLPADIDGDGWVSSLDVAKVQFCIDNRIYDMLCDINADGVIDEEDLNLVKAHLDRGTPRKGVIWTPTLSPTAQVEVQKIIKV